MALLLYVNLLLSVSEHRALYNGLKLHKSGIEHPLPHVLISIATDPKLHQHSLSVYRRVCTLCGSYLRYLEAYPSLSPTALSPRLTASWSQTR
jgi:hypothetical protein